MVHVRVSLFSLQLSEKHFFHLLGHVSFVSDLGDLSLVFQTCYYPQIPDSCNFIIGWVTDIPGLGISSGYCS